METTIIIPCKDNLQYTKKCLCSITNHTSVPHKIIVVDDGSNEKTKEFLQEIKGITLISNKKSLGFPSACNLGALRNKSDFFVLMNNDIEVTKNWLRMLLDNMKADPKLGIVGPKTNYVSGPQMDPNAHYNSAKELEQYAAAIRNRKPPRLEYFPRIVFFCVLIRTALYNKIGGLDENFGLGNFEDDDYCLRATLTGWNCAIDHNVFVHHYGSKTFGKMGKGYGDLLKKNRTYFMQKWGSAKI